MRLDQQEIIKRIHQLHKKDAVQIAARAAMRVLPLLTNLWPPDSIMAKLKRRAGLAKKLDDNANMALAVFRACQCAYANSFVGKIDAGRAVDAACGDAVRVAIAYSTAETITYAVAYAAERAAYAVTRAAAANATADAVRRSVLAITNNTILYSAITWDLDYLTRAGNLAKQPLWPESMPDELQVHWQSLRSNLLKLDAGFEYWVDWYEARLKGEAQDWEKIRDQILLPKEILSQKPADINAYLLKLAKGQAIRPLNRVRMILLGPGEAGKTSLLRALHGEPVVEGKEEKTVGIEIRESRFDTVRNHYVSAAENDTDTAVHFWDFGGQVMYHATHQFFLRSNCVYVLVLDGRRAAAGGSEADYWLEHVRAFAPDAQVLLVGNKADHHAPMDWEQSRLRGKYPNILPGGFYRISCVDTLHASYDFIRFRSDLHQALEKAGMVQQKFTEAEFSVLKALRSRSADENFLSKADYQTLCVKQGLDDKQEALTQLLGLLDKLGVIIHFPKIAELDDYLLNPRWLTYGVYQILERQQPRVTKHQVFEWLAEADVRDNLGHKLIYPKERCGFLLEAMENFQVAFRLQRSQESTYVIPSLLPTEEPDALDFNEAEARVFRFRFDGLLPPQLLPQLIVARHVDIEGGKMWRHGVLLRTQAQGGARALLRGDAYDRTLTLWITGKGLEHYFAVLYQAVQDILSSMPELQREELIRLPASARLDDEPFVARETEPWVSWNNVLCAWHHGEKTCYGDGMRYDLAKVLNIMAESELIKRANIQNYYDYRGSNMRDKITVNGGQIGAVGSEAHAENNTFQQVNQGADKLDLTALSEELAKLLPAMKQAATETDHYDALAAISKAQVAAQNNDSAALLEHLKLAGSWTLDVAKQIGVPVAIELLKKLAGV